MKQPWRQIWDRLSIYLPIILMGLMALGSWWLVRSTPSVLPTPQTEKPRHEPDYFMRNFSIKTFNAEGRLKAEVFGALARHFPDNDVLEIEQARVRSLSETGVWTTASALRALTNGDGSEVQLLGDARVIREATVANDGQTLVALEFQSDFLHAFTDTEKLKSHKPVRLRRGDDQFSADSMEFDNVARVLSLQGHVHGELQSRTSR